jgi:hypothetical protein
MDPQRRTLIVTGAVLLIILVIIFGTVFFLIRTILNRPSTSPTPSPLDRVGLFPNESASPTATLPGVTATPGPVNDNNPQPPVTGDLETFSGPVFQAQYPKNWGILTCNNSRNVELDPGSSNDQLNIGCDIAAKSVTIIVGQNTCTGGQVVTLGGMQVRKVVGPVQTNLGGSGTQYHWCTLTPTPLDITHRVGTGRAFSADDHAQQVEQMISSLRFAAP